MTACGSLRTLDGAAGFPEADTPDDPILPESGQGRFRSGRLRSTFWAPRATAASGRLSFGLAVWDRRSADLATR